MLKKIFRGIGVAVLLAAFNVSTVNATVYPPCPFPAESGRTIVKFPVSTGPGDFTYEFTERIVSDTVNYPDFSYKTPPVSVSLAAGNYDVRIFGADVGIDRINLNPKELNEQFFIILNNGSTEVARTNETDDLPDDVNSVGQEKLVNANLSLGQSVDSILAYHANYPDSASANSVVPICAAFDLIPPPSTPPPTPTPISNPPIPKLTVVKTVVNTGGGTKTVADFHLFVGTTQVTSGQETGFTPGTYQVSETTSSDYTASSWGGDCSSSGSITLASGDDKTCTITNTYVPPEPPVNRSSGGGRRRPPVVLSATVDTPLIQVVKSANPTFLVSGGQVVYTNVVTNPGTVALSNILIADDKCAPLTYDSGDLNNNSRLDTNETWVYTCQSYLTATTTNTVTVEGTANNITVRDFDIATVTVDIPAFPRTGFPEKGSTSNTTNLIMLGITLGLPVSLYALAKRKTREIN